MAHWIIEDKGFGRVYYRCSNCNETWNDLFNSGIGSWDVCPNCGKELDDDAIEWVEEKQPLKKIADTVGKLQIPTLDIKWGAFKEVEETLHKLEQVSGMTLDELIEKFAAGWVLSPPESKGISLSELRARLEKYGEEED